LRFVALKTGRRNIMRYQLTLYSPRFSGRVEIFPNFSIKCQISSFALRFRAICNLAITSLRCTPLSHEFTFPTFATFAALATFAAFATLSGHTAALTYPTASGACSTTLQACINAAPSNDVVEIATNTPIAELVTIDKSLSLQPAAGFSPTVQGVFATATTTNINVTIRGLVVTQTLRAVLGAGGGNLAFLAFDNVITASSSSAISVSDSSANGSYGSKTVIISRNRITQSGTSRSCFDAISVSGIRVSGFNASISDNVITATDLDQCAAISTGISEGVIANSLIERNRITGSNFNAGISVANFGAAIGNVGGGQLTARIFNNLVARQFGNVGGSGGIVASASGNSAVIDASIVNNTVADGRTGIRVNARTDLGASIVGSLANNIAARNSQTGISIDSSLTAYSNTNNLVYANTSNFFTPGPNTRTGDPAFVNAAAGNYQLSPASDAIDRGLNSALPVTSTLDVIRNPRVQNAAIDIGAYESSFAASAAGAFGVPTLPWIGLCVLALALAVSGARRGKSPLGKQ
jgi:hypothetical protein